MTYMIPFPPLPTEITLVDANIVVDYVIGVTKVDISDLRLDEETQIKVQFGEVGNCPGRFGGAAASAASGRDIPRALTPAYRSYRSRPYI